MKFAEDLQQEGHVITAYAETSITINGRQFTQSLIITPSKLKENWPVPRIGDLLPDHVDHLTSLEPELIVIGTGQKLVFPAVEAYASVIRKNIGIEFMDTGAACRTYNILMSEGRNIVAGLII